MRKDDDARVGRLLKRDKETRLYDFSCISTSKFGRQMSLESRLAPIVG